MANQLHILVVEDNRDIRELVSRYLIEHGINTSTAVNGKEMRQVLERESIDLIVLDRMLPGVDGLTLCREMRSHSNIPIIMLTAMADYTDRVVGLEMGADDYMTKPFDPGELLARIRTVLRRSQNQCRPRQFGNEAMIHFADWTLFMARRELVDQQGIIEPLSSGEFDLLLAFLHHPRKVLSRDQLLDLLHGRTAENYDRSIDTQVMRLRRKIETNPKEPQIIKTVWGGGYMFALEVSVT